MAVETTTFSNNSADTWFRDIMFDCVLCPRACHVNRLAGQTGYCGQTAELMAARASLHYWEEPCISGTSGSGTVFFSGCNLRCVFCQNHNIALGKAGRVIAPEHLEAELALIRRDAVVRVLPYGSITRGQKGRGELVDFGALAGEVVGFSDDGRGVQGEELMAEAMRRAAAVGKPIVAHCEVDELLKGGYIHDGVYCREHGHKGICSESEWRQVERDIKLAAETGCQYHVCHVSTKESVELIRRAKAAGLKVSGETAPHYLLLCDEDLQEDGRFKMNPPLRGREDREALRQAVADGTIEVIATDHAPHTAEQKSRGLAGSAMGIVGLECAFPLLYTYLVKPGLLTLEQLVERMSMAPRRIFGLGGGLQAGEPADLTVFDLDAEYEIDPETFLSKGRATPFAGWRVAGRTLWTLVGGRTAYATERFR